MIFEKSIMNLASVCPVRVSRITTINRPIRVTPIIMPHINHANRTITNHLTHTDIMISIAIVVVFILVVTIILKRD